MRKNFNMLSGIVNSHMGHNLYSGDVFVFVNSANNMMKLLRYEPGGLVIYNKRLDHGCMHLVERVQDGDPSITPLEWNKLVSTIQGIIDDPRRRLQRLKALRDAQMEASLLEKKNL
ncbi:MAG: IS66 family insertion sequence element accessory protein TnpB [Mailhella sp.]|nr:IS66 family insertion sequence element accessory protein TnpB [Mailhella sp.]